MAKQSVFVFFRALRKKSLWFPEEGLAAVEQVVQAVFQVLTLFFQGCSPVLGADPQGRVNQEGGLTERQGHLEAVPGVESNPAGAGRGHGKDGGTGLPGQIKDSLLSHVEGTPGAIRGQGHGMSLTDFADQVLESFKAALGPGPRADLISQPPTYVTEKLAVPTGADHEDDGGFGAAVDGAEIHAPKDMAVPQGKDDRGLGLQQGHAFRVPLQGSPGGAQRGPDEAQGQARPSGMLEAKFQKGVLGREARSHRGPQPVLLKLTGSVLLFFVQ